MPLLQVRDIPEDLYENLSKAAKMDNRSIAQETIVLLRSALKLKEERIARRKRVLDEIKSIQIGESDSFPDPAELIPGGPFQMTAVLDANAGIELVLKREKSYQIKKLIESCRLIISSELYKAEVTNTLWKYYMGGFIDKETGTELLHLSQELIDEYADSIDYSIEAFNESIRHNHSSYDMFYFTLARRTGSVLVSIDKKLNRLARKEGIDTLFPQ